MIEYVIIAILIIATIAASYVAMVQYRKNEEYETAIVEFYSAVALVLHTIRMLDEKQMFEEDDEVGSVFNQLVDVVNELRPIIYGIQNADTTTEE
jgi:uncharacterized OB-fold protein